MHWSARTILLSVFCVALAACAVTNGWSQDESANGQAAFVSSMVLRRETESRLERNYTGTIKARRASDLGFKRIGRVEQVRVEQGMTVRQGDILATLDTASIKAELKIAEAQAKGANSVLDELLAGPRKETIAAAAAQVREAEARRDQLRLLYERRLSLINSDAIARQDIDDAKHQWRAAEASLQSRKDFLDELQAGTRSEKIAAQQAELSRLAAVVESLKVQLDESTLVAPFDGIVAKRFIDEGAIVQPATAILRVLETGTLEVWVGLPLDVAQELRVGGKYQIATDRKTHQATMAALLPELEETTRTQTAIFAFATEDQAVDAKPLQQPLPYAIGQVVQLKVAKSVATEGFWVPLTALARGAKGLWSIYVIQQGESAGQAIVRRSDVEVVIIEEERVLVTGALVEGDRIVTSGVQKLTSGQQVRFQSEQVLDNKR